MRCSSPGITPWTEAQLAKVNEQADIVYADFTAKVAEGRKMPIDRVQDVARGRVWTGADALERGLVDELGGFWAAVDDVKMLAGIDADHARAVQDLSGGRRLLRHGLASPRDVIGVTEGAARPACVDGEPSRCAR